MKNQWEKFKHRTLTKVFLGYSVVAWVLIQVIEAVLPTFETPLWVAQTITFLLILGFPIAILVGWASEKLPTASPDSGNTSAQAQMAHATPRKTLIWIGIGACMVVGLFGFYMMPFIFDQDAFQNSDYAAASNEPIGEIRNITRGNRTRILLGETGLHVSGLRTQIALSPDGVSLVYVRHQMGMGSELVLRDLRFVDSERVLGTIYGPARGAPRFSPDGEWIVFQNNRTLNRVRIEGGAFQEIAGTEVARFLSDHAVMGDYLYFVRQGENSLMRVPFSSGGASEAENLEVTGEHLAFNNPHALPGGTKLLLTSGCSPQNAVNSCNVSIFDTETLKARTLIETASSGRYANSGHIVFVRDSALWAVPFDLETEQIVGQQVPMVQGIETNSNFIVSSFTMDASGDTLIYVPGEDTNAGMENVQITWVEVGGKRVALPLPEGNYGSINISPNEDRLALTSYSESSSDIWIWDIEQEIFSRLTFGGSAMVPIWSPDGLNIVYQKSDTPYGLWIVPADGTSQPIEVLTTDRPVFPETMTDDGEILFSTLGDRKLYSANIALNGTNGTSPEREQTLIDIGPNQVRSSRISPDGQWLLYTSNESGEFETFIRPWPDYNGGKWQASRLGGGQPLWDQDNNRLYFWSTSSGIQYSTEYEIVMDDRTSRASFRFQSPEEIFAYNEPRNNRALPGWTFSKSRGKFLMIAQGGIADRSVEERVLDQQTILVSVENWLRELRTTSPQGEL